MSQKTDCENMGEQLKIIDTFGDYRTGFIENNYFGDKVKIHFVEKNYHIKNDLSLIYSHGLWEPAERAMPLFDGLDNHCISFSYRGRGQSDTPTQGYDLEHHVSDFRTVVEKLNLKDFVVIAFSRGVGYACGYVSKYPEKVKGLILVDHPPIHVKPGPGYADYWKNLIYLGNRISKYMRSYALDALEHEAREVIFWDALSQLEIPILLFRGTNKKSKIVSDLTGDDVVNYKKYVKNLVVIDFEYSGHMIVDEELGKYRIVVNDFINSLR